LFQAQVFGGVYSEGTVIFMSPGVLRCALVAT
jgi:hypothetical protein